MATIDETYIAFMSLLKEHTGALRALGEDIHPDIYRQACLIGNKIKAKSYSSPRHATTDMDDILDILARQELRFGHPIEDDLTGLRQLVEEYEATHRQLPGVARRFERLERFADKGIRTGALAVDAHDLLGHVAYDERFYREK